MIAWEHKSLVGHNGTRAKARSRVVRRRPRKRFNFAERRAARTKARYNVAHKSEASSAADFEVHRPAPRFLTRLELLRNPLRISYRMGNIAAMKRPGDLHKNAVISQECKRPLSFAEGNHDDCRSVDENDRIFVLLKIISEFAILQIRFGRT